MLALRERPGDGDLRRGGAVPLGDRLDDLDDAQIGLQRLLLEARVGAAEVAVLEVGRGDGPGEETPAERRERDERRAVGGAPADHVARLAGARDRAGAGGL